MDKLEYDSLHKFLVSLGVIFIALPFVVLYFVFSNDVILISQIDFDGLSQYSQNLLQQQSFSLENSDYCSSYCLRIIVCCGYHSVSYRNN